MRTTLVWCPTCGAMFNKQQDCCPECETPRAGADDSDFYTRRVRTARVAQRWSSNLNAQAQHAVDHT